MAYLPLSTANLPDPVIDPAQGASPEDYFNTVLYTGDGTDDRGVTGVGFQPDWVWLKTRSVADNHVLQDVVRGAQKQLITNATDGEFSATNQVKSFDSDGFTLGTDSGVNGNTITFVAWNWKANGSGVTNTDGSITSTVSANTTSGFSIVSYSGNGSSGATIGHGLDSTPEMVIVKRRDAANNWPVFTETLGGTKALHLDETVAQQTSSNYWNNTAPTSSVFTVGAGNSVNNSSGTYIAYCFHSVEGFSKFGSYVGNGSADGPFVYTGFRPAFVIVKRTDVANNWVMQDTKRDPYNVANASLLADRSDAETDFGIDFDYLSNGFKIRSTNNPENASGGTYIYMAFAENPFKYSNAR